MNTEYTTGLKAAIAGGIAICLATVFWLFCLNHVNVTDIGITYNSITGEIGVQEHPGWYATSPFTRVAHMSLLPMRITIPSQARIINQKMVRFRKEGAIEFVKLQGFSMMLNSEQENIMLGYAFSGQKFPFLEILEEPKPETR
jgi:hypothetical protein